MKTIKEMTAIMQAFADGKQIQRSKDGVTWVDDEEPIWDWSIFYYRISPKKELPKTWEDYCKINPIKRGEAFINPSSNMLTYKCDEYKRDADEDKNLLPNKKTAEAMLALCQLIQLRDYYNEGWQPDWKNVTEYKYIILVKGDVVNKGLRVDITQILTFKTEELCDEFLKNFKDLIEIAKPLL